MVSSSIRIVIQVLVSLVLLSTSAASRPTSPILAGAIGKQCANGGKDTGTPKGRNITIAGVPTYVSEPQSPGNSSSSSKKVVLFYSDVYGPFHINAQLLQDRYAARGFYVVGIDYFLGDPAGLYATQPDFIPFDPTWDFVAWLAKSRVQARELLPKWNDAIFERYGRNAKYTVVGYCFGAIYTMEMTMTDKIVAAALAHPADLMEDHFTNLGKPLLLSSPEHDIAFSPQNLSRAVEIMTNAKKTYHVQIFSGVLHGFTTRGNLTDENEIWAKEESARSIAKWFDRFSE